MISDIMMPGITGLEFCRKIKNNIRTSHIFVILLTARIGDDYELRGYEFGADCYLTKPFNIDILFNRINHFIELQKKRNRNFLQESQISGEENSYSKVDAQFINKAIECVEKNLGDENYSVELFSDEMCMSRMNLYRKLRSLTGQKPSEFIRIIRLKKAAVLLTTTTDSVVEIAEKVGFSTPGYFSKCFKELYGVLPTQYKK